jgi:23S rRNA pseudouridine1911/1915/1917 synthase
MTRFRLRPPAARAPAETSERLARRIQREHPELSYSRAKGVVEAGQVTVDGAVVREAGAWVAETATVSFDAGRPRHGGEPRLELLHVDADLVVVAKPAGLLSVPTTLGGERETLVSRLQKELRRRVGGSFVAVVHRLDRDTSGLLAFARNLAAQHALQEQLLDHSLGRVYDAVVEGDVEAEAGTFDWPLVGDGVRRRRWIAGPGEEGKWAVTHWRVTERFGAATRVEVRLETGRTHQIRIHFAAAGHPVLGDPV